MTVLTALLFPIAIFSRKKFSYIVRLSLKVFIFSLKKICLLKFEITGTLPSAPGNLILSTHHSLLDVFFLFDVADKEKTIFIGKKEILYVFPFGVIAAFVGLMEYIDRAKTIESVKKLKKISKALKEKNIVLYPSGTRNSDSYRSGFTLMINEYTKAIVPVVMKYPDNFWKYGIIRPGKIEMKILSSITPSKDKQEMLDKVQEAMIIS